MTGFGVCIVAYALVALAGCTAANETDGAGDAHAEPPAGADVGTGGNVGGNAEAPLPDSAPPSGGTESHDDMRRSGEDARPVRDVGSASDAGPVPADALIGRQDASPPGDAQVADAAVMRADGFLAPPDAAARPDAAASPDAARPPTGRYRLLTSTVRFRAMGARNAVKAAIQTSFSATGDGYTVKGVLR